MDRVFPFPFLKITFRESGLGVQQAEAVIIRFPAPLSDNSEPCSRLRIFSGYRRAFPKSSIDEESPLIEMIIDVNKKMFLGKTYMQMFFVFSTSLNRYHYFLELITF